MSLYSRFAGVALLLAALAPAAHAQHALRARVLDAHARTPLPGANAVLEGTTTGGAADADGFVTVAPIPPGSFTIVFSSIGYEPHSLTLTFPLADTATVEVELEEAEHELEEAVVSVTRAGRTIADVPTRVEVIGEEELGEKITMDPSGIQMVLNESPGIVVQQASAVSASAGFRIQGLDGRYTQLLRDGFPLYGGLGGGLSILQIPPLDLQQVEVVKGPASTLYGGGAIAGLVNLVSRRPTATPERLLLVNGTTAGGLDLAGYAAHRTDRRGYTVLASGHLQRAYDAEDDAFTNLPATRRLTLTPTLYHYGAGTLTLGLSGTLEDREGGYVVAVREGAPGYTERNRSARLTALAGYERPLGGDARLTLRSSGSLFRRTLDVPGFRFGGTQLATYTEASVAVPRGPHALVLGLDARTERFDQGVGEAAPLDYAQASVGLFAQDTWDVSPLVALEGGLRVDAAADHGAFVLPRAGLLLRPGGGLTARIGGGLGYKVPTPFLEEAEARAFRAVRPVPPGARAERSVGGTMDVHYRAVLGPVALTLNQALYATRLTSPLVPVLAADTLAFVSSTGHVYTRGSETTARISYADFSLFLGYVYLDADRVEADGAARHLPLTARHRTYSVLVWEQHGRGRVGLEAYYTGGQDLPDGGEAPGYLVAGVMAQRTFGRVTLFANLENVLDARQSRTSPLVLGPALAPTFPAVWGPTDGFIANAGVRLAL